MYKSKKNIIVSLFLSFLLVFSFMINHSQGKTKEDQNTDSKVIKIAIFDCAKNDVYFYNKALIQIFNYEWSIGNTSYTFKVTLIDNNDILCYTSDSLTVDNFDLFIICGNARSYLYDGIHKKWNNNIQKFVADGGGFLGICGGANAASFGYENPDNLFKKRVNNGVLKIANVYINDDFFGEWQYIIKMGVKEVPFEIDSNHTFSCISLNTSVYKNNNPIFSDYDKDHLLISYAGGPGMYNANKSDPKQGKITPLIIYNEEPMLTKPIHYWTYGINGWEKIKTIKTDLYGTYAGITTVYNSSGRVILYGSHPEHSLFSTDGMIIEYLGHGCHPFNFFKQYVYRYVGEPDLYKNRWMIVRSAAWAAKIPDHDLPDVEKTFVDLYQPSFYDKEIIYYRDNVNYIKFLNFAPNFIKNLFKKPIIIGDFTVRILSSNNIQKIELFIDGEFKKTFTDTEQNLYGLPVYNYSIDNKLIGLHGLKVKAYSNTDVVVWDEVEAFFI